MLRFILKYPAAVALVIMTIAYVADHHPMGTKPSLAELATRAVVVDTMFRKSHQIVGDDMGNYVTPVQVGHHQVNMLIDTGATFVSLTSEDAAALGIQPKPEDFTLQLNSAEGVTKVAQMRVNCIRIGDVTVHNVDTIVMAPGAASGSLLGMSFLRRLGSFQVTDGRMTLEE